MVNLGGSISLFKGELGILLRPDVRTLSSQNGLVTFRIIIWEIRGRVTNPRVQHPSRPIAANAIQLAPHTPQQSALKSHRNTTFTRLLIIDRSPKRFADDQSCILGRPKGESDSERERRPRRRMQPCSRSPARTRRTFVVAGSDDSGMHPDAQPLRKCASKTSRKDRYQSTVGPHNTIGIPHQSRVLGCAQPYFKCLGHRSRPINGVNKHDLALWLVMYPLLWLNPCHMLRRLLPSVAISIPHCKRP